MGEAMTEMPKRIEIAYKDALDNIALLKKQQWVIVGYAVAIHAAIFTVCEKIQPPPYARFLLILVIVVVSVYGIVVLHSFYDGMDKFRNRLKWIYVNRFDADEQKSLLGLDKDFRLDSDRSPYERIFSGGLFVILALSGLIASLAVWFVHGQATMWFE